MKQQFRKHRKATNGYIVTFGIVPTKPETGYGYERKGDDVISLEKPDQVAAIDFIAKEIFFGTAECFVLRQAFCWKNEKLFILKYMKNQNGLGKQY
jgi:mannose-1-phosphate guanylyltransferase